MIRLKPNNNFRIAVHILLVSKKSGQISSLTEGMSFRLCCFYTSAPLFGCGRLAEF